MVEVKDIYNLLPKIDCGMCGNPTCWTFARRVYTNLQEAHDCLPNRDKRNMDIEEIIRKGITLVRKKGEQKVVEFQPCGEYEKITLESQLSTIDNSPFDILDSEEMCLLLRDAPIFTEAKCSVDAGYAMLNSQGEGVHIFRAGKVIIRRAPDKTSALKILNSARRVLWGSVTCSCGNTAASYGGGAVKNCHERQFPPLLWGLSRQETDMKTLEEIMPKIPNLECGKTFLNVLEGLGATTRTLNSFMGKVSKGARIDLTSYRNPIDQMIESTRKSCLTFMTRTRRDEDASLGLALIGLTLDLTRISKSLNAFQTSEKHLVKIALDISLEGLKSLLEKENPCESSLFKDFMEEFKESAKDENIFRIALNGSYIASIMSTKFPI